jgi:hypothetical protein
MIVCPFCLARLPRGAIACRTCNARRGYPMFGNTPDRPVVALLKGVILPVAMLPASVLGFVMRPTPVWFAVAGFALFLLVLGVRRLMSGSHWYQL